MYGKPESTGTVGNTDFGTIRGITLVAGADVMAQNLPLDPSGVVYDAVTRVPVAGAIVMLSGPPGFNPATQLVGGAGNVNQTTGPTGQYQYLLFVGAPIGDYTLTVTAPTGYLPAPSSLIPACPNTLTVAPLPAPALVQDSATAPPLADPLHDPNTCAATTANLVFTAGQGSTQYYFTFNLSAIPGGSADLLNNHIPLDPITGDVLTIVKTAGLVNVSRGDLVPFTLTIRNNLQGPVTNIDIVDQLPPGFKYRDGSATLDGVAREPVAHGKQLIWADLNFTGAQQRVIKRIAVVGAGVAEANYSNRAWGVNRLVNLVVTNIAQATVRVVPDPLIDCSDVIGKVFADRNANGYQDGGEPGLPNVRIATVRGLLTTTDQHGRYHITCVRIPDEERGSNAIFKLDERTLPSGFELTTENPRVIRLTRGKMGKVNFGATEHVSPTDPDDTSRAGPADIHFSDDPLEQTPALNVHATPNAAPFGGSVRFMPYSNYQAWIVRAEMRLFATGHGASSHPVDVLPVQIGETVTWQIPEAPDYDSVDFVLRVYDAEDHFDETRTKRLHLAHPDFAGRDDDLLAGYGEDSLEVTNIPVSGGAVTINGTDMQPGQTITVMGQAVPIDHEGRFAMRQIMPAGPHLIDVRIESADGSTTEFERSVNIAADDWMYVALADLTVGRNYTDGPIELVTGREADRYDQEAYVDGRLAFYLKGKIKGEYLITAAADTREQPLHHLFDNFSAKDPRSLLRRLDADRHYPIYGDDSTTVEDAPTQGRFYVRIERGESQVLWGDFHVRMSDSELIRQNRGLYGARLRLHTEGQTSFGDKRGQIDAFAAEPGHYRREMNSAVRAVRSITCGVRTSWKVRNGSRLNFATRTRQLAPYQDYDLNYLQGRVLLTEPLASTISDDRLVRTGSLSGHHAYLVVTYEYTPGLAKVEDFAVGGRAFYWLNDHLRLGLTNYRQDSPGTKQDLYGADMLMRMTDGTYLKFEAARSEGPGSGSQQSIDGGFNFFTRGGMRSKADAYHLEAAVDLGDMGWHDRGSARAYWQDRDDGFSGPGQVTGGRDAARKGVELDLNLTNASALSLNANESKGDGSRRRSLEFDIDQHFANVWSIGLGMRADDNEVSTLGASPTLNRGGSRSDLAVRLGFDPGLEGRFTWNSYVFAQGTVHRSGDRKRNDRIGLGGDMRLTDRFTVSSEVSTGKAGLGASLGGEYQRNDRTSHYLSYALDPDRGNTGFRGRQGRLTSGTRLRFKKHGSLFGEQRLQHGDGPSGLTRAFGLDLSNGDRWTYGLRGEFGRITDPVAGDLKRRAGGASLGYNRDAMNYAADFEYRDESGTLGDRNTWLLRNNFGYQIDPDWRALARVNISFSNGAGGNFADGEFAEAIGGFAFRPVDLDRLNMLFRYRFFYDLPSPGQLSDAGGFADFAQRSHILAADASYELTPKFSIGGKVAWKHGELRDSRTRAQWFDSETLFGVARVDFHVTRKWDAVLEGRVFDIKQADDRRMGALFGLYRHINDNVKFGVGYNFTDFSDDLTDLDYDNDGFFFNLIGKY